MVLLDSNGLQPTKHKGHNMVHTTHNDTMINGNLWDYRGTGYTRAFVVADRIASERFIGYIPTKDEYVLATRFEGGAYGWSHYARDTHELEEMLKNANIRGYEAILLEVIDNTHDLCFDISLNEVA